MTAIRRALDALRSMDDDTFDPSDFADGLNPSDPDPGGEFDPDNWDAVDTAGPDDDDDLDDRACGYCPLCGAEHDNPDSGDCPEESYTLSLTRQPEYEYRPYAGPGLEYR
jgi:hypothetical protein